MNLEDYQTRLRIIVCDAAISRATFADRLAHMWMEYFYKIDWNQLESLVMEEDAPLVRELRFRLRDNISEKINAKKNTLRCLMAESPRPVSEEWLSKNVHALTVIREMNPKAAKATLAKIIDLYCAIAQAIEHGR